MSTPENTTSDETLTPEELLVDLSELHLQTLVSPSPKHPAAHGWRATAGSMAAGFTRTLHALNEIAPEKAAELTTWFRGEFDEGPDPEEHTEWVERAIAKSPEAFERWINEARERATKAEEATKEWERKRLPAA